jgi:hypothetical protein
MIKIKFPEFFCEDGKEQENWYLILLVKCEVLEKCLNFSGPISSKNFYHIQKI